MTLEYRCSSLQQWTSFCDTLTAPCLVALRAEALTRFDSFTRLEVVADDWSSTDLASWAWNYHIDLDFSRSSSTALFLLHPSNPTLLTSLPREMTQESLDALCEALSVSGKYDAPLTLYPYLPSFSVTRFLSTHRHVCLGSVLLVLTARLLARS